jgi:hypothetical protein
VSLWRAQPEIRDRPIPEPIVILGQMRSGTTRLQRLLACDDRFAHTRLYESLIPAPFGRTPGRGFFLGWLTGVTFYLATTNWVGYTIMHYTAVPWPVAMGIVLIMASALGCYHGAFAAGIRLFQRSGRDIVWLAAPLWVTLEWLRGWFFIGFPWAALGYSQHRAHDLVQIAEVTGVYGVSAVLILFNVVVAVWHLPPVYNLALAVHPLHIVQHLTFMAAATLMWWPLLSPLPELPRLPYPGQMLYCFLMSIPMSIIAIYVVMAERSLYPAYASAPRIWGLSPMADQQIGGLIMWIPGGLFFLLVMTVIFFKWAGREEDGIAVAQPTAAR